MKDYIRRFFIAGIMALCVSLLFLGGKHSKAAEPKIPELTEHWVWPADGVITDTFGTREGQHKGIDIAGDSGSPVYAVDAGIVSRSYYSQTYGNVIFIKHNNQTETVYAHLDKRFSAEGESVGLGQKIGLMGSTGDSSGVHLHFEIHTQAWTADKINAVDPSVAFGMGEVGQAVNAVMKVENAREVSARPSNFESGKIKNGFEETYHIVKTGETLWSIAAHYNLRAGEIADLNNINPDHIFSGQKLLIKPVKSLEYTVKQGDTLSSIAKMHDTTAETIKELNNADSDTIKIGQILIIRKK
ncbi:MULTISPECIES: LysM peptidoglycan-binding domain-containing protein [Cytobacillus]|uniref:LysM peptidoglycan-binding domain-containing protein n=1 Tax=Cytobacillus TaxID=2675230 RepID=UPI00204264DA|nr:MULTISPECIES: LysM peptidoglycan-binding domain-containing protein [Cytobacillus]MCS0826495.1 LysM peptidoglycan-binding domain-containing protein [Cytobacillus firmus]MCM3243642.1 LysM peptidoglycan-binding domain-containing protein [Cytobacillus oceanisediminis]MCM3393881.1 LysM peptidoglycan-binding domain-containing protein [Cytobacillus oceanisediminis]UQX54541.1 LysM peptidoglycan-binding domain-containing protein [Cytobacillus pseudoceanisediminis]USK42965.1 LysM peptidoglycan-bindin